MRIVLSDGLRAAGPACRTSRPIEQIHRRIVNGKDCDRDCRSAGDITGQIFNSVGKGELEGELPRDDVVKRGWIEYGTVTGRERRVAPFNFNLAKKAVILNGATQIAITKIDVAFPECKGIKNFEELSKEAKSFVQEVESRTKVPVTLISTGPDTDHLIDLRDEKIRERKQ